MIDSWANGLLPDVVVRALVLPDIFVAFQLEECVQGGSHSKHPRFTVNVERCPGNKFQRPYVYNYLLFCLVPFGSFERGHG